MADSSSKNPTHFSRRSTTQGESEKQNLELGNRKRKHMNVSSYKALFKKHSRRITPADDVKELKIPENLPQVGSIKRKEDRENRGGECSGRVGEKSREECLERASEGTLRRSRCSSNHYNLGTVGSIVEVELLNPRQKPGFTAQPYQPSKEDGINASKDSGKVVETTGDSKNAPKMGTLEISVSSSVRKSLAGDTHLGIQDMALTSKREVDKVTDDSVIAAGVVVDNSNAYALSSPAVGGKRHLLTETYIPCSKRRRVEPSEQDSGGQDSCFCNISLNRDFHGTTIPQHVHGALLLRDKIDQKEYLALENKHLNLSCYKEEEANSVNAKLKPWKEMFLSSKEKIKEPDFSKDCLSAHDATTKEQLNSSMSHSVSVKLYSVEVGIEGTPQNHRMADKKLQKFNKRIKRKCEKSMAKLVKRQEEEIHEFYRSWDQKMVVLEKDHKMESARVCSTYRHTIRRYKLNMLDEEFARKMKKYQCQKDTCLKELEDNHLRERIEESETVSHLLEKEKLSASEDKTHNEMPLQRSHNGNQVGYLKASELGTQDGPESFSSLSRDLMEEQTPHEIPSVPENIPYGTVGCRIPITTPSDNVKSDSESEVETVAFEKASMGRVEQPNRADDLIDISKNIISVTASDPVKCSDDGVQAKVQAETTPNEEVRVIDFVEVGALESNKGNDRKDGNGSDILHAVENPKDGVSNSMGPKLTSMGEKVPIVQPVVSPACDRLLPPNAHQNGASLMKDKIDCKEILALPTKHLNSTCCKEKEANLLNAVLKQSEEIFSITEKLVKKRMENLVKKHKEEIQKFRKSWDQKRFALEKDHKMDSARICSTYRHTERTYKLKILDKEFATKMKEYKCQKDMFLKDLEDNQLRERNEESQKAAHWLAEAKLYASEDRAHGGLPLHESQNGNQVGYFEACGTQNGPVNFFSLPRDLMDEPSLHEFSSIPEVIPSVEVNSNYGYKVGAVPLERASVDIVEQPNRADNSMYLSKNFFSMIPYDPGKHIDDGILARLLAETMATEEVLVDYVEVETPVAEESNKENDGGNGIGSGILNAVGNPADGVSKLTSAGEKVPFVQPAVSLACDNPLPLTPVLQNECRRSLPCSKLCLEDTLDNCGTSPRVQIPPLQTVDIRPFEKLNHGDQLVQPPEKTQPSLSRNVPTMQSPISLCPANGLMNVPRFSASELPFGDDVHIMEKQCPDEVSQNMHVCGAAPAYIPQTVPNVAVVACSIPTETENTLQLTLESEYKEVEANMTSEKGSSDRSDEGSQLLAFTKTPKEGDQGSLEVVPPLKHLDAGQNDQSNHEDLLVEPPNELHFSLPTSLPFSQNQTDMPPLGRLLDEPLPSEDPSDLLDHAILLTDENLELHPPLGENQPDLPGENQPGPNLSLIQGCNNYNQVASQMSTLPSYADDPLKKELDRICEETEQVVRIHEATELRLKSDRDKEIAEIMSKYEAKHYDEQVAFLLKKGELNEKYHKVLMNRILAEAFRSTGMDLRLSGAIGMQQAVPDTSMQQLHHLSSSAGQASAIQQFQVPPPLQTVHQSAALFSSTPTRNPNINQIIPSSGNLQIGPEIRAPAPHIQHFWPSESLLVPFLPAILPNHLF